jgi:hypothetical protein
MECNAGAPSDRKRQLYFVEPNFPGRSSAGSRSVLRSANSRSARGGYSSRPVVVPVTYTPERKLGVAIGMEHQLASIALRRKRMGVGTLGENYPVGCGGRSQEGIASPPVRTGPTDSYASCFCLVWCSGGADLRPQILSSPE